MNENDTLKKGGMRIFLTIPNIFTLSNALFGTISIYFSLIHNYYYAFLAIIIAIICDGLDGFVARKLNAVNDMGKELDSLSDQVSFGVAPAVMLMMITIQTSQDLVLWAIISGAVFVMFGVLRLARFNIYGSKDFFEGFAIPSAAFFSTLSVLCIYSYSPILVIIIYLVVAFLMISSIAFPSAKTRIGVKSIIFSLIIGAIYFVILILCLHISDLLMASLWLLFSEILGYITTGPIIFQLLLKK